MTQSVFSRWRPVFRVCEPERIWDEAPTTSGVYVILGRRSLSRAGGKDAAGILYVGRASNLRSRLRKFLRANHTASRFLGGFPQLAQIILGGRIRTRSDVEQHLGDLRVRLATPIPTHQLATAERAVLYAYLSRFGEAPPLNLSLPQRHLERPNPRDLRWGEEGIEARP